MKRFIITYLAPPKAAMEAMMNATPEQKAEKKTAAQPRAWRVVEFINAL